MQRLPDCHSYGTCLVRLLSSGEAVGLVGIKDVTVDGCFVPDLGFLISPIYHRQGLGYEASVACLKKGFEIEGFERVMASTDTTNTVALALLSKLGFHYKKIVDVQSGSVVHAASSLWEMTRARWESSAAR